MDDAPMLRTDKGKPDTTARHVLQVLAEHARPDGTNSHPSVLRIQYRTGYDRTTVQRALRRLEIGELIFKTGTVEGRTKYRLALRARRPETDWAALEREEEAGRAAVAERVRKHRAKRVTDSTPVTVTDSASVTEGPVTHSASVSNGRRVRYVTDSASVRNARNAALTTINHQPTTSNRDAAPEPDPSELQAAAPVAQDPQRSAADFLRDLPAPWSVGRVTAEALAPLLLQSLADTGWSLDADLAAKLTEKPEGINNHRSILRIRITDLPKRPRAKASRALPDWCGHCAGGDPTAETDPSLRWVDTPDGTTPCPKCSLQVHRNPAA